MRIKILAAIAACGALAYAAPVKADGFVAGATVGFIGGAIIGAHASPYYYAPYGYAPVYYQPVQSYGYGVPTAYSSPAYAVASPCWGRRQPVYDQFGDVVAVRYQQNCR